MASQAFWHSQVLSYWDSQVLSHASAGRQEQLEAALSAGGRATACDPASGGDSACDPASGGDSALLLAARGGHAGCCRLLLAHGAQAQAQGGGGHTPLMAAIVGGSPELVELLLPATANLLLSTDGRLSAFALACLHRRPWALHALLQRQDALLGGSAGTAVLGSSLSGGSSPPQPPAACYCSAAVEQRRQAVGQQLLLAMYAAVASGDANCLQLLADHPLARAAYSAQFGAAAAAAAAAAPLQMSGQEGGELQDGLGFLLDASLVGQRNARAASFLWQTSEWWWPAAAAAGWGLRWHGGMKAGGSCAKRSTLAACRPVRKLPQKPLPAHPCNCPCSRRAQPPGRCNRPSRLPACPAHLRLLLS